MIRIWSMSRIAGFSSVYIDPHTVFAYCDKYDLDRVDTLEMAKHIQMEVDSGKGT